MMENRVELLAPAGDLEKLKWALMYGADAVYIGGRDFSLRANATNFSIEEIREACLYAHKLNKKVYVTINIVFHNKDFKGLEEYILDIYKAGVDAVIVSDLGCIMKIKEVCPNIEIHLSTQASCMNKESAKFYKNLGIKRVVLARECSKDEIKNIIDETGIDTECFIHGAMCVGLSGRCVLSNYMTNRDSNRGGCSQICRWDFDLYDEDKNEIKNDTKFTMCSKDLSMLRYIEDMINIGIKSFKIEGRMRSIYYIATIVHTYRKVIDAILNKEEFDIIEAERILRRVANRDNVPQFFDKKPGVNEQYYLGREEISNQDFLGIVLDYDEKNNIATIEQRNYFKLGDEVQIFGPNTKTITFKIEKIIDEENNLIDVARHPRQIIKINVSSKVSKNDIMRIKY
ncbi:MAG: U32 family peptidase [Bacilli bacterium]|nr:U32 family peptidase [Bacilli bacterium]